MSNKILFGAVLLIVVGLLGWTIVRAKPATLTENSVAQKTEIDYTDTGFSPNSITVKQGTPVTFVNKSSRGMWVASNDHPTHLLLPGFDELSSVPNGGSYTYTFAKVGTWGFHNHVHPSDMGSVVVN